MAGDGGRPVGEEPAAADGKGAQLYSDGRMEMDKKTKLVKRGYTIDTWDFDYTAGRHSWLNFQVNDDTYWGIMHGDNSGYYEAFNQMATLYAHLE